MIRQTPRQWTISYEGSHFLVRTDVHPVKIFVSGLNKKGNYSNACLIAAAPDLLRACEIALASDDKSVKQVLSAAIDKAKG